MPLERELKFKLDSHAIVLPLLAEHGEHIHFMRETNILLDKPDRSLRKADCSLRVRFIREETGPVSYALITFKGPAEQSPPFRDAFDVKASPSAQVVPLLKSLGFEELFSFEKERDSWRLGECLVELDRLPHFGFFVEIEGPTESVIDSVRKQLWITDSPHPTSYSQMVSEYLKELGRKSLRFDQFTHERES